MDTTSVSALAGVLGSLAGGSVTIGAALIGKSRWSRLTAVEADV